MTTISKRLGVVFAVGGLAGSTFAILFFDRPVLQAFDSWFAMVGGYAVGNWIGEQVIGWWKR